MMISSNSPRTDSRQAGRFASSFLTIIVKDTCLVRSPWPVVRSPGVRPVSSLTTDYGLLKALTPFFAARRPLLQCLDALLHGGDRALPGEVAMDMLACSLPFRTRLFRLLHHHTHERAQGGRVRFGQPRVVHGFLVAQTLLRKMRHAGRDQEGVCFVAEIECGSITRHDDGQTTGHRLRDGQPEALAAIRVDQAVTGGVEPGHVVL